jgi:hypothetical protein
MPPNKRLQPTPQARLKLKVSRHFELSVIGGFVGAAEPQGVSLPIYETHFLVQSKTAFIQLVILSIAACFLSITLQGIRVYVVPKTNSDWTIFFGGISAAIAFVCLGAAITLLPKDWEEWIEKNIPFDRSSLRSKFWGGILFVIMGLLILFFSLRNLFRYLGYI